MTIDTLSRQGRAPGLYDEQLQRQQQEKKLFGTRRSPRGRLGGAGGRSAPQGEEA